MPSNLLILPLLGGFLFLHLCHRFRFRAQRSDGYRLLFESSMAAALLLLCARLLIVVVKHLPFGPWLKGHWDGFAPIAYLGTGAAALSLGPLFAYSYNWLSNPGRIRDLKRPLSWKRPRRSWARLTRLARRRSRRTSDRFRDAEIRNHGNALVRLIHTADKNSLLVSITLSNRKWYVGYIAEAWSLDPQEAYFRLLPILSGYRDKDTLQTIRKNYYKPVYEQPGVDARRFVIVIPVKDVQMANLFDEEVYEDHFADAGDRSPSSPAAGATPPETPAP